MDAVQRFRQRVARDLGDRQGTERRYSAGDDVQEVASALGVAPMSLRRWAQEPAFRPVHMVPDERTASGVVVTITADGVRVEGLDLDTAAQFVARLR